MKNYQKIFLVFTLTLFVTNLFAQRKKKGKSGGEELYFGIGLLLDNQGEIPYAGAQVLNLGYYRLFEKKIKGIELGGSYFRRVGFDEDFLQKKLHHFGIELKAYQLYKLKEINQIQLYGGFTMSMTYRDDYRLPFTTSIFSHRNQTLYLGGGGKALARVRLSKKLSFLAQTSLTLLEGGLEIIIDENPTLDRRSQKKKRLGGNLFRRRFEFLVGLSFKI